MHLICNITLSFYRFQKKLMWENLINIMQFVCSFIPFWVVVIFKISEETMQGDIVNNMYLIYSFMLLHLVAVILKINKENSTKGPD